MHIQKLKHFLFLQTIITELYIGAGLSGVFEPLPTQQECLKYYKIIENEGSIDIRSLHTYVTSNLLCSFLHNLSDCLLCAHLYEDWVEASMIRNDKERIDKILTLCQKLPKQNYALLQHILMIFKTIHYSFCGGDVLYNSYDLAFFVGHHMLWPTHPCKKRPQGTAFREKDLHIVRTNRNVCKVILCLIKDTNSIINIWDFIDFTEL